jgi:tetratricopeptide (TPR) repeat protein
MTWFAGMLLLTAVLQTPVPDRARAEGLARGGRTVEAMDLFKQIVNLNPADVEARLWVARLALRLGRVDEAEGGFRSVLREHPEDVDARVGLGTVLTRTGDWQGALEVLRPAEQTAGENADLFSALARAYRRGGDDQRALENFGRARTLAPDDPDVALGYEAVARSYGHWIAVEGFGQTGAAGDVGSGSITVDVRMMPRLHLEAMGRAQKGPATPTRPAARAAYGMPGGRRLLHFARSVARATSRSLPATSPATWCITPLSSKSGPASAA